MEEEDARAREDPTPSTGRWGVAGAGPAPSATEPSRAAAAMVAAVAQRLGEPLTPDQHRALAAKYDTAVAVVTTLMDEGADVHPSHLPEYIDAGYHRPDGTPTYQDLYAVLSYRLSEAQVRGTLPGFVARRVASEASETRGGSGAWGVGAPPVQQTPQSGSAGRRCLIHSTLYIPDPSGFGLHCPTCEDDRPAPPAGPRTVLETLPEPSQQDSYGRHCGNNACNREQRTILKRVGEHVWSEPCPVCRPGEGGFAS